MWVYVCMWALSQSCRTRVLDLDSGRTRVRFLADLDLDLDSVVKDLDLDLEAKDLDVDLDSVVKDSDLDLDLDITCLQTIAVHLEINSINIIIIHHRPPGAGMAFRDLLTYWFSHCALRAKYFHQLPLPRRRCQNRGRGTARRLERSHTSVPTYCCSCYCAS